jgi:hypothetical protein
VIRTAQRGVELSRYFPTERRLRQPAITELDADQRVEVIDVFTGLFEGLYAHLPLKRSMYGIDPVQRLRLLKLRVDQLDSLSFHYELAGIVTGLRDAHTRYVGPAELAGRAAMLPFLVEAYGPVKAPRYIVSKMLADPSLIEDCQSFQPGVEIRWWNAVPMDRAVDRHADQETGGRTDTRRARALESMTLRALQYCPPPDERWVTVGYLDLAGKPSELRVSWRMVTARQSSQLAPPAAGRGDRARGIDPAAETHRQVKKLLFAPHQWYADHQQAGSASKRPVSRQPTAEAGWLPTSMPDVLAAKEKTVRGQRLGYLRLWSFDVADDQAYVEEVTRLLGLLPDRGLIIDLRSNPGGLIWAAERLLQLLTPNPVQPVRFSMLATSLTRAMAAAPQNAAELEPWRQSLQDALADGEAYSCATPISQLQGTFQVYGGPVVAIVDPNTYSAGDLFAAGFVDNAIGPLIGIGEATGAGGANVWSPQQVQDALLGTAFEQRQLPAGIGYTLSVRRATRVGPVDGAAIEDVGVRADRQYSMTKRDLTGSNEDLLAFAGRLVLQRRYSRLTVTAPAVGQPLAVRTHNIDQLDVIVDGRHQPSRTAPVASVRVELPSDWTEVEIQGRARGELLQRRRLTAS